MWLYDNPADESTWIKIIKNGSTTLAQYRHNFSVTGQQYTWQIQTLVSLAADDYIEIVVDNNDVSNTTLVEYGAEKSFVEVSLVP